VSDPSEELSLDEIRRISGSFGSLLWLAFSGGEIFLRNDIVEISQTFYRNNKPAIMLFPTNGMLPDLIKERTERILKDCPKSVITVKLSLDGLHSGHDAIRNTPDSFERTMRTYDLLGGLLEKYPHFELGINTVFCSENEGKMDILIDFVRRLKNVKTHTISLVRGNLLDEEFKRVDFAKYLEAIGRLEENLKNKSSGVYRFRGAKIKAAQDILQRRLIHQTTVGQKRLLPCYAGKLNVVLTEDGEVYPCEILSQSFGNIRNHDFDIKKILRTDRAKNIIRSIKDEKCFCTHECYLMTNILFTPALYPKLLKEYLQV